MSEDLTIYGVVGEFENSADAFRERIARLDPSDTLTVRIDSPGGSVFDGFAIWNAIADHKGKKKAIIEAAAFSIASYILTAFDEVEIARNGYIMIHNPSVTSDGDDEQHAKDAKLLAKLKESMISSYAEKTGKTEAQIRKMMKEETYLDAQEALEMGLVTKVTASGNRSRILSLDLPKLPQKVTASLLSEGPEDTSPTPPKEPTMTDKPAAATIKEIRAIYTDATDAFVIKAIETEMTAEDVQSAMITDLQDKISAQVEEIATLKAQIQEELDEKAKAQEEAEVKAKEEAEAKATAEGSDPIEGVADPVKASAKERWTAAVAQVIETSPGITRSNAVAKANRLNPGLRNEYLSEVNNR